jgi:hypothetical protein
VDGPLGLADYLTDPWLRYRTGQPSLGRDPAAERASASAYLSEQPAEWRALVKEQAAVLPPLARGTRLVVFLPAENEAALIEPCLSAIARDLVSSGLHRAAEIVVVRQHRTGSDLDDTAERVSRWARLHRQEVTVRLIEVEWPAGCRTFLALSRKLAVDVTVERAIAAELRHPLYFLTEDADVEWIESGRARWAVAAFDARPRLDALRGWHLRSLELLEYLPLFVERLTWRACEYALSAPQLRPERNPQYGFAWNRVVTAGWNVAFTLESYVLAGGYTPTVELFEDMDLGQRISVMRGTHTAAGFVPGTDTIHWMPLEACSDGRRSLAALATGSDLYGPAPSLSGFVTVTAQARQWPMLAAVESARRAAPPQAVEEVLARRQAEVAAMVGDKDALDLVMRTAYDRLAILDLHDLDGLRARQESFLAAARAVAAGQASSRYAAALGRRAGPGRRTRQSADGKD